MEIVRVFASGPFRHLLLGVVATCRHVVLVNVSGCLVARGPLFLRSSRGNERDVRVQAQFVVGVGWLFCGRQTFFPGVARGFFFLYYRRFRGLSFSCRGRLGLLIVGLVFVIGMGWGL